MPEEKSLTKNLPDPLMPKAGGPERTTLKNDVPLWQAILPIAFLAGLISYGLILLPMMTGDSENRLPLENIFILAAVFAIAQLLFTGHKWKDVQASIVSKLARALPAFFILFSIGLIIASWMICGTIPMLVYYGLKFIDPRFLYLLAFVAPIIFSTLTGTSWGSAGTIGVVLIGIAAALDANLAIVAGAVVGGAYFGDKLSPLSDTTNIASLAAEVDVYDHIQSMLWTTIPSAVFAASVYLVVGLVDPPAAASGEIESVELFLTSLESLFRFNPLLLIPPVVVLAGSLLRKPIIPTLFTSIVAACVLAVLFQPFSFQDLSATMHKGFQVTMSEAWVPSGIADDALRNALVTAFEMTGQPSFLEMIRQEDLRIAEAAKESANSERIQVLLNRGGLYALNDAIITAFMVFIFIGAIDHISAMKRVVEAALKFAKRQWMTIVASLLATGFVVGLTSNVYASSFIVGDAFKSKYDQMKIPRNILSRSLEDTGTMLETLLPFSLATIYMSETLGVSFWDYVSWQLLSIANIVLAFAYALGRGVKSSAK